MVGFDGSPRPLGGMGRGQLFQREEAPLPGSPAALQGGTSGSGSPSYRPGSNSGVSTPTHRRGDSAMMDIVHSPLRFANDGGPLPHGGDQGDQGMDQ